MYWDDGLEVQVEVGLILVGSAGVEIELEGDGDDVAYGVLRLFGEARDVFSLGGSDCSGGRLGRSGVWQGATEAGSSTRRARARRIGASGLRSTFGDSSHGPTS